MRKRKILISLFVIIGLFLGYKYFVTYPLRSVLHNLYKTQVISELDYWQTYKDKISQSESFISPSAIEDRVLDDFFLQMIVTFNDLNSDTHVSKVKTRFLERKTWDKMVCEYLVTLKLTSHDQLTSEIVTFKGEAELKRNGLIWQVNHLRHLESNIHRVYKKLKDK